MYHFTAKAHIHDFISYQGSGFNSFTLVLVQHGMEAVNSRCDHYGNNDRDRRFVKHGARTSKQYRAKAVIGRNTKATPRLGSRAELHKTVVPGSRSRKGPDSGSRSQRGRKGAEFILRPGGPSRGRELVKIKGPNRETAARAPTDGPPFGAAARCHRRAPKAGPAPMNKRNRVYARRPLTAPGERPSSTSGKSYPQKEILQLSNAQERSATPAAAAPRRRNAFVNYRRLRANRVRRALTRRLSKSFDQSDHGVSHAEVQLLMFM